MPRKRFLLKTVVASARVTEPVMREIERIVWVEGYTNVGDYIRNLIRKDFKERGITPEMHAEEEAEP